MIHIIEEQELINTDGDCPVIPVAEFGEESL